MDLEPFLGPCRVVHCIGVHPLVEWAHIRHAIDHNTAPLLPYYEAQGKLTEIDGMGDIATVAAAIDGALV